MSKQINLLQLTVLTCAAIASSPKEEQEQQFQEWADATLASLPVSVLEEMHEKRLLEQDARPTAAGMKLALNGCSFTPNFKLLAESDFNTAIKMLFTGQEALVAKVSQSETGEIMPKKNANGEWENTQMCDNLLKIADWIYGVTTTYRQSLQPATTTKKSKQ